MKFKHFKKLRNYILLLVLFISCMTVFVWENLINKEFLHAYKISISSKFLDKPRTDDMYQLRRWNYKTQIIQDINCNVIINGNSTINISGYHAENIPAMQFVYMTKNCSEFLQERSYITDSLTPDEEEFPIAYCIVVYKDIFQVEKLLRAIYRPQNFYCFHVDRKSGIEFRQALSAIASCFLNVFIAETSVDVQWGTFSVLETQLICMKELMIYKWKYFINLAGQEFPLKTNGEIVQILKAYNNTNDIHCPRGRHEIWKLRWVGAGNSPHNIRPHKGPLMMTVTRGFVEFVLSDQRAIDFLNWTKNTNIPDETYFNTLHFNTQLKIPGSEYGNIEHEDGLNPSVQRYFARLVMWYDQGVKCGKFVRGVCMLGLKELPSLVSRPELFANKFLSSYQPLALDCLNEWLNNRTRDNFLHGHIFNTDVYKKKNMYLTSSF